MLLSRKVYKILKKEMISARKIQRAFRKYIRIKRFQAELDYNKKVQAFKLSTPPKQELKESRVSETKIENKLINKPSKETKEKEKLLQKQKDSIRHLYEPALRKMNTAKMRLQKIQSNKDLEESTKGYENKLSKKTSHPIMVRENSLENMTNNDSFSNKMENTKKINNLIANTNNMINNLTKIYGVEKKKEGKITENKRNKAYEDENINDLFRFFHKKINK